jgi:hypothetical protein
MITKENVQQMLTAYGVFPAFLNVLQAFGQRTESVDDPYSGYWCQQNTDPTSFGRQKSYECGNQNLLLI